VTALLNDRCVDTRDLDQLSINTIRTLAIDAVQAANSGRPGTPMALAPVACTLWQQFLRFDPGDPIWPNRDRFVLSAGHAPTPLYALLHLPRVFEVADRIHVQRLGRRATVTTPQYHSMSGAVAIMTGAAAPPPPPRDSYPKRRPRASVAAQYCPGRPRILAGHGR
jgi:transketolase